MRVAVTGATGFVGSAVVAALRARDDEVVTVGRRPFEGLPWRGWDAATGHPDLSDVEVVIHAAAAVGDPRPGVDAAMFRAVNVDGGRRLLDAAGDARVVWVSSSSVYDVRRSRTLVTEDHPINGGHLNAYGATKAVGDAMALTAGARVLRPRAVYGPGDRHLLPRLLRACRRGRMVLPRPDVEMSVVHVDNLASACLAAADWAPGAYNIGDRRPVRRDATLSAVIAAATGRAVRVHHVPFALADNAARVVARAGRLIGSEVLLTPYAVDAVGRRVVLDIGRAADTGWTPRDEMPGYLSWLAARGARA